MKTHQPRKRFGQNFLHDPQVIQRIVSAIAPQPGDHMVEIGPGQGALTLPLLECAGNMDAIELDRDLIAPLRTNATLVGELRIHQSDALRFDFDQLFPGEAIRVVGNLPYNISTPLLFHLLASVNHIQDMHFMLQKEVVNRITASPGSKAYGRLSVMIQYRCRVASLFIVGSGAFTPPPKVDSAIVRLIPHQTPPIQVDDETIFAQLVTQSFSQRRKTLRNTLKGLLSADEISAAGVDPTQRAETLDLTAFAALANMVSGQSTAD